MCVYLSRVGLCRSNPWWWWDATRPTPRRRKELGSVQNRKFSLWISGLSWLWLCAIGVSSCGIFHHKPSIPGSSMTMGPPISFQHLFSPSWSTFPVDLPSKRSRTARTQGSASLVERPGGFIGGQIWWLRLIFMGIFRGDLLLVTIHDYTELCLMVIKLWFNDD